MGEVEEGEFLLSDRWAIISVAWTVPNTLAIYQQDFLTLLSQPRSRTLGWLIAVRA